jgi:OOP family OmpA-OmpF porin
MQQAAIRNAAIAAGIGLALAIPPGASAQDSPWYLGGSIGQSRVKLDTGGLSSDLAAAGMANTGFSGNETDTGFKLFGGYRFHPNFAVEGGYAELGEFSASGTVTTFNFAPIVPLPTKVTIKVGQGLHLAVVGNLPLANQFSVFGRLGGYNVRTEMKVTVSGISSSESARNTGFLLGAGVGYDFTRNVGMRVEWEQFNKVGDKDKTGQGDVGLLSVGLVYRF